MIQAAMAEDYLSERIRAEDILLGALGFGEDASIVSIQRTADGFTGTGQFKDGEQFSFENDDEVSDLENWAVAILLQELTKKP